MKESGVLMKRLINVCFCLLVVMFLFSVVNAELIDGPANFRDKPNGKILFSLNDKVDVQYEEPKNNWSFCGLFVYVKASSIKGIDSKRDTDIKKINKNTILYDTNKQIIGKTLDVVEIWRDYTKIDNDFYECLITGYTFRNNIRWETSIERAFESVINSCRSEIITLSYLEPHMKKYQYFDYYNKKNGFQAFEYPENDLNDESPIGRIILIFYKDNLAAILYQRQMNFTKYKVTRKIGTYKVIDLHGNLGVDYENYLKMVTTLTGE